MARPQLSIVPLEPKHLQALAAQPQMPQSILEQVEDPAAVDMLCAQISYAALRGEDVVAAAGVVRLWTGRAAGWLYTGRIRRRDWPEVTRAVEHCFEEIRAAGIWRIEISVVVGFQSGHRWARRLGFEIDAKLRAFLPDGSDAFLYSRIDRPPEPA